MYRKTIATFTLIVLFSTLFNVQFQIPAKSASADESLTPNESEVMAMVNGTNVYNYDLELENIALNHHAFRSGGSAGANETTVLVKDYFESYGLETWFEPFEFKTWDLTSKPTFMIDLDGNQSTSNDQTFVQSFQCDHLSWPTPQNGTFSDLVVLPLPDASSRSEIGTRSIDVTAWNAANTSGKILLIGKEVRWSTSWTQTFLGKLADQTPAALVFTWWYDWMSFTPLVISSAGGRSYWSLELPVGFVSYEDGLWIRNMESTENVSAFVSVDSVIGSGTHYNIVGKIGGYENPEKLVMVCGHYDSVMCGGFCDNGAGTAGVLEVARVFARAVEENNFRPNYTVLFVAFACEEFWLVGSINYVMMHKSEMSNILAVINLDCVGNDKFQITETNSIGGFDLDQAVLDAANDLGVSAVFESPGDSDHETFRNPSEADYLYYDSWGLRAGISNVPRVESSVMLISSPLFYSDKWDVGTAGWIHTSYDNSSSMVNFGWVKPVNLEGQVKVAALSAMRVSILGHDLGRSFLFPWWAVVFVVALVAVMSVVGVWFVRKRKATVADENLVV